MKKRLISAGICIALLSFFAFRTAPRESAEPPQAAKAKASLRQELSPKSPFSSFENRIYAAPDEKAVRIILSDLRGSLRADKKQGATARIREYLKSGRNVPTGLNFELTEGGRLLSASSLRAVLLAELGEIDSRAAAEFARSILARPTSEEEWAIALRNYAWGTDNSREDSFLHEKTAELVTNAEWLSEPQAAFLESFDLVPYTRNVTLVGDLLSYTSESRPPALRHAAFIALDKLTQEAPDSVARKLAEIRPSGATEPIVRSSLMARLNPSKAAERQLMADYLTSSEISGAERVEFYRLFPLTSNYVGRNLVTDNSIASLGEMARRDLAAAEMLKSWRNDVRFKSQADQIEKALQRLQQHLQTARNQGLFEPEVGRS